MTTERSVETQNGLVSAVDFGGSNFPIVFLHGSASSSAVFCRQLSSPLSEQFRLITVDLPGHGKSANARDPSVNYSIQGMAQTIAEGLRAIDVRRAVFCGWSLGGHIAIQLMADTDLVAGLMLTGTPPIAPGPMGLLRGFQLSTDMLLTSKPHYSAEDATRMTRLCFDDDPPAGAVAMAMRADGRMRTAVSKSFLYGNGMSDQRRAIQTAAVPIAFIDGENDNFIRTSYVAALDIPTLWDRYLLPDAGHAAFWSRSQTYNAILQRFALEAAIRPATEALADRRRQISGSHFH
jgi:pimeloyl-ACP methyl ester carboxylesterase